MSNFFAAFLLGLPLGALVLAGIRADGGLETAFMFVAALAYIVVLATVALAFAKANLALGTEVPE